jgi:signal transduction histidine kinase
MRLADFLDQARDRILDDAVAFAQTIPALQATDERTLRDHLPALLKVIAADLQTAQTRSQSIAKSRGDAPDAAATTSAQTHGLMRARDGIDIEQLVAEFRALRSSILRQWADDHAPGPGAVDEIMRFNEAIDQAVAESVEFYAQERERWREIFLGILGHDLRTPLNAVGLTVEMMHRKALAPPAHTALLARGVRRMTSLLDSLLEYNRASLGVGMALERAPTDLAEACAEELELQRAANPQAQIAFHAQGSTDGVFDASRVREALSNLVSNAVKHGGAEPVVVTVRGDAASVQVSVENAGALPTSEIERLFEPLRQRETRSAERTHLGLGLFIVRQIARAHGGEVEGAGVDGKVRFTLDLPKQA